MSHNFLTSPVAKLAGTKQAFSGTLFTQTEIVAGGGTDPFTLLGTGIGTHALPANFWTPGKSIRGSLSGVWGNPSSGDQTRSVFFQDIQTFASSPVDVGFSATNAEWWMEFALTCLTTGVSGKFSGRCSWLTYDDTGHDFFIAPIQIFMPGTAGPGDFTFDTTAGMNMDVVQQFSILGNTVTTDHFTLEVLNPAS